MMQATIEPVVSRLAHGSTVRYVGRGDMVFTELKTGNTYRVFGWTEAADSGRWPRVDCLNVYVDDPKDNFGGVATAPASDFVEEANANRY